MADRSLIAPHPSRPARCAKRRTAGRRRLAIESLESRRVLSADIAVGLGGNEPHLAVNPTDPANIAISQGGQLRISTDFGDTFAGPFTAQLPPGLPAGYTVDGDDVVAFDAQGRLFWTYLILFDGNGDGDRSDAGIDDIGVAMQRIDNPTTFTGTFANAAVDVTPGLHFDDKQWLAVDANPASPYAGNVYLRWTRFDNSPTDEMFSRSTDGGVTYSAPVSIAGGGGEGFRHQANVSVAANGDIFTTYHTTVSDQDESNGDVIVMRDSSGGALLAAGGNPPAGVFKLSLAGATGQSIEVTANRQPQSPTVPKAHFLMQGASASYILADPVRPGNVYVIANDDPNDLAGSGDDGDIVLARSTDNGITWSLSRIDHAPQGPASLQVFPMAAIDQEGNLSVFWYDTRRQINNNNGTAGDATDDYWNLDVYVTVSRDGGLTFSPDFRVNDQPFDPQLGAPNFRNDSPPTFRIGEYNGIASFQGATYLAWTGNTGTGQQILFDLFSTSGAFADEHEPNNFRSTATILGSVPQVTVADATLDRPDDADFYQVTASETGQLIVRGFFNEGARNLLVRLLDRNGNVLETATLATLVPGLDTLTLFAPVVGQQTYFVQVQPDPTAGGDQIGNPLVYDLEIENYAVPTPFVVDLQAATDSGRSDNDDITRITSATFDILVDDDALVARGFVRDTDLDVQVFNNGTLLGEATFAGDHRWTFTATPGALQEGHNNFLTAAVLLRDGATPQVTGRGDFSPPLQVTLDTIAPPVSILGLEPPDDTAGPASATGLHDLVTRVTAPRFFGRAEANAVITLRVDGMVNGVLDVPAEFARTVAIPYDGDEVFASGQWSAKFIRDLNDSTWFPLDGAREALVTAGDVAGNESTMAADDILAFVIDTQGPRVTSVEVNAAGSAYDLFDPKPSTSGPTPRVNSLVVSFSDGPDRGATPPALSYVALDPIVAGTAGNYQLIGDANGVIPIKSIQVLNVAPPASGPAIARVTLEFYSPLPDDRYTLRVADGLLDLAGNALDGESNAAEPQETPLLPSGDRAAGGDFVARFTVDTRAELGVYASGSVYVDTNGNSLFDPTNLDATNRDINYVLGFTSDNLFAGNFVGNVNGVADGFDKLAAYGKVGASYRWLIDTDNDGVPNLNVSQPLVAGVSNVNGLPAAGNFDGVAANGDEVALKIGNIWLLDTNHDFRVDLRLAGSNMVGLPIIGDFDGDGIDDLGAWADDRFTFDLSSTDGVIDGAADVLFGFGFAGTRERPVAADIDGDSITDFGLWVPDRGGVTPREDSEWYWFVSAGRTLPVRLAADGGVVQYKPTPFGADEFAQFGDEFGLPVPGNFDPPVTPQLLPGSQSNPQNELDVDNDGAIAPIDALLVINWLNSETANSTNSPFVRAPFVDVDGDGICSPRDALLVINQLNQLAATVVAGTSDAGEGEGDVSMTPTPSSKATPQVDPFAQAATIDAERSDEGQLPEEVDVVFAEWAGEWDADASLDESRGEEA